MPLLRSRDGRPTTLVMRDGRVLTVVNIAWGLDEGEDYEHITTNISPQFDGASVDFFLTSEVENIVAPETGQSLWIAG